MLEDRERKLVSRTYEGERFDVAFVKQLPLEGSAYPGFHPEVKTLKQGSVNGKDAKPLDCDIVFERDVPVKLRDGVTIYTDILRPATREKVPALIAWTPYGKHFHIHDFPGGIARETVSNLQKQECPDPGFWCAHGYAVVQPDTRGAWNSEGDTVQWGREEGEDACDLIEWAARQEWCSGKIGMNGNSWGAVGQWWAAAQNPPHLAAIAPWEGLADVYNEIICRGGIPDTGFQELCVSLMTGHGYAENASDMLEKYPLASHPYWKSKMVPAEKITVPAYIVASYVSTLHTHGTFDVYRRIGSKEKWLRVHNTHEWPDLYEYQEDLKRFFDYYLKGIQNDWKQTPKVRLSVLDREGADDVNRPEEDWPLPDTEYRRLFLDANKRTLDAETPEQEGAATYRADDRAGKVLFSMPVQKDMEFTGYFAAHLYVSTDEADDADLFVYVVKQDETGRLLPPVVKGAPFSGEKGAEMFIPNGRLRVSGRGLDEERSTEAEPVLKHVRCEKIEPGKVYRVDIPLWPIGMKVRQGQELVLIISGYNLNPEEWPEIPPLPTVNKGNVTIHTGGEYRSYITAPCVER